MATYYMSTTGNNANAGTIGSPWRTLASAASHLLAGDILNIRSGTYPDAGFNFPPVIGTSGNPAIVQAYPLGGTGPGVETVVFDGGGAPTNFFNSGNASGASKYVHFKNFTVQNYGVPSQPTVASGSGMWFGWFTAGTTSQGIKVLGCTFKNIGSHTAQDHAIYFSRGCQSAEVAYCTFIEPSGSCIQIAHAPGTQTAYFHDNMFFGGTWGMTLGDGASAVSVTNNLFVNNIGFTSRWSERDDPAFPASGTVNLTLDSNIFRGCSIAIENTADYHGTVKIESNCFFSNTSIGKTGTSEVKLDPSFVSYNTSGTGDYHLNSGSPCIGAATATNASVIDFDGNARPSGGGYDIGPLQFATGGSDVTAPTLSVPTGSATGQTTGIGRILTNEANGLCYCWTTVNTTETAANIVANGDSTAVAAAVTITFVLAGLNASTTYYTHFTHEDDALNRSNAANSAAFTTAAPPAGTNSPSVGGNFRRRFHIR